MSNQERIVQLIQGIPDTKLYYIIDILESMKAYAGEEIEPDEWDLAMIKEAEEENDGESISIEDFAKELGIELPYKN